MATYVLVHGACHGAWCWHKVVPLLEKAGHKAIALDSPSFGRDRTPLSEVTLQRYVDSLLQVVDAQPEPVILVGHSRGGIVISQAAEQRPAKVKALVYLTAVLIPGGEATFPWLIQDVSSVLLSSFVVNEAEGYGIVKPEAVRQCFYGDCSDEDVALAQLLLMPEPMAPNMTPLNLTAENFGRIPKVYIETLQDQALTIGLQRKMQATWPLAQVITLDTSHSPFFSAPKDLVRHLTEIQVPEAMELA